MPRLPRIQLFRRKNYVLKARCDGQWEDVAEFDKKVNFSDVKDVIDEYREEGCDFFRLVEYPGGKAVWAKSYKKRRKEGGIEQVRQLLEEVQKLREDLKQLLGIKDMTPEDLIANIMYWDSIKEMIAKKLANQLQRQETSGGSLKELEEVFELLGRFMQLRQQGAIPSLPRSTPRQAQQAEQPSFELPQLEQVKAINYEEAPPEIQREVEEIAEKAATKVEKELSECMVCKQAEQG